MFNKTSQSYVRHLERMFGNKGSILQCLTQMNHLNFAETIRAAKGLLELWKVFLLCAPFKYSVQLSSLCTRNENKYFIVKLRTLCNKLKFIV